MDMTNFIRQSQTNGHTDQSPNNTSRDQYSNNSKSNKNGIKVINNGISITDIKRKASSLDSINAVERELDEVLKDLELNSQDLNEQLEENEFNMKNGNNNSTNKTVELPIIIQQKNLKLESNSSCSSPSMSLNKNNNNNNNNSFTDKSKTNINKSEFMRNQNNCELFIDDCDDTKSLDESNGKKNINGINGVRKRQNIISTYELCHDCFDQSLLSNSGKANKNHFHNCNETTKVTSPINGHNHFHHQHQQQQQQQQTPQPQSTVPTTTTTYSHMINPLKFTSSYSNQELSNSPNGHFYNGNNGNHNQFQHHGNGNGGDSLLMNNNVYQNGNSNGRSRSVLSQINESVIPENNFKTPPSSIQQFARNNNNNNNNKIHSNGVSNNNNSNTGNVISQKVISIGMPNKSLSKDGDLSPSPKQMESKSNFDSC
jgi:hypothetical protein